MSDIPKSRWARGTKLLSTLTQMAAKEIGTRLPGAALEAAERLQVRVEQTRLLVETLTQMKGAAMKAGQLLSLEGQDFLPPEVLEVLQGLQSEAKFMPEAEVQRILQNELGTKLQSLKVHPTPLAAASIGQVHRATTNGQTLALKIQYPGIADSIETDVAMLKGLVEKFYFITGKKADLTALFEEVKTLLVQETNYSLEADFMQTYAKAFEGRAGFRVPKAVSEYSTHKLLAMEFIEAMRLSDWIKIASASQKQKLGEQVMELFLIEYLEVGLVQTDPNLGNFLVDHDENLVLLDFGACKSYSEDFRHRYRNILRFAMERKRPELLEESLAFGLLDAREEQNARDLYLQMMDVVIAPFRHQGIFDFSQETYSKASRDASIQFARALKYSPPPKNIIFLHRKLGGVFQILKRLEVKMDMGEVWKKMMK